MSHEHSFLYCYPKSLEMPGLRKNLSFSAVGLIKHTRIQCNSLSTNNLIWCLRRLTLNVDFKLKEKIRSIKIMTTIQCTELKIGRNASEFSNMFYFLKNKWVKRNSYKNKKLLTKTVEKTSPKKSFFNIQKVFAGALSYLIGLYGYNIATITNNRPKLILYYQVLRLTWSFLSGE